MVSARDGLHLTQTLTVLVLEVTEVSRTKATLCFEFSLDFIFMISNPSNSVPFFL